MFFIVFLLTLMVLILVHEFGHYLAARWFNIKILRFSIGFGRPLLRWRDVRGTEFVLAWCLLGGYVRLLDERETAVKPEDLPYAFNRQSIIKRVCVIAAGPAINVLFALIVYWCVFAVGIVRPLPIIGQVLPHSIAAAKLQPNEQIISVRARSVQDWREVVIELLKAYKQDDLLALQVKNNTQLQTYQLNIRDWQLNKLRPDLLMSLGIVPYFPAKKTEWPADKLHLFKAPVWQAWHPAIAATINSCVLNLVIIKKLLLQQVSLDSLGGPISIYQGASAFLKEGMVHYLDFLGLLSISLAIFNMLPIPGLDGGQLLLLGLEQIRRKPLSVAVQVLLFRLSVIALAVLMVRTLANDILRLN